MTSSRQRLATLAGPLAWILAVASVPAARSQPSASPATTSSDVVTMNNYDVSDVPLKEQILPTARPIGSVLGDSESILDTPRSVTSVNEEWMKERSVRDTMDLGQFSPGVYSPSEYGLACIPQIRGELSEIYVDGQTTKFNRNSILPSFNGVEAIDIVKGPGSAVYGPQSDAAGGYVNLVMKSPFFDATHGEVEYNIAGWTSGHSYSNPEFQLDVGGPVSQDLAYRVSYLSRYGDGYYQFSKNDTQDVYTALDYNLSKTVKFEWWAQYYADVETSSPGWNRPTQAMLDDGIYIGGPVNTLGNFGQTFAQGPYFFTLNPATAFVTKLQPYVQLTSPYDFVHSDKFESQLKTTAAVSDGSTLVNLLYFEDESERQRSLYGYSNYVPTSWRVSDRLELHDEFGIGSVKNRVIAGVDAHHDRLISYEDFSDEPISPYDLTESPYKIVLPGYFQTGNLGGFNVPGQFGYSGSAFAESGDQDSTITEVGAFFQDSVSFTDKLSAVVGIRGDEIKASSESPLFVGMPVGSLYQASASSFDPSYFASLVYKLPANISAYATFDRVNAILGSANFSGIDGTGGNVGLKRATKSLSKLYEVGFKQSLLHDELYYSVAAFQQKRMDPQLLGPADVTRNNGLEFETVYQPSKRWSFNANATYQDGTTYGSFFYEQTGSYLDFYPKGYVVDGRLGTGLGSPDYSGYSPPSGHIRSPGVPQFMANAFIKYDSPMGWAVGLGPIYQGNMNANDEETLIIRKQAEWDGFVSYHTKRYLVQVSVKNFTNALLFDPIDVTFAGNDQVMPRPPITASFTARYYF